MTPAKKTPVAVPIDGSVAEFLAAVPDAGRRADAEQLAQLMTEVSGEQAAMWGGNIVGFGQYHYRYASGHEGDAALVGFSPRKTALVIYLVGGYEERYASALAKLGPHKTGKGCLYLKRLADVDLTVLRDLINRTVKVHRGMNQ